jgi:hypothetical protein
MSSERRTYMDNAERVTRLHPQSDAASAGEMVPRPQATAARRDQQQEAIIPVAVSQSSYLNEKDRHYRAAETMENGADLAKRGIKNLLDLDRRLQEAEAEGASPRALAGIEQLEQIYVNSTGNVVCDFMNRPGERW